MRFDPALGSVIHPGDVVPGVARCTGIRKRGGKPRRRPPIAQQSVPRRICRSRLMFSKYHSRNLGARSEAGRSMNAKQRERLAEGIVAILDATGDQKVFKVVGVRIWGPGGRERPERVVQAGSSDTPGMWYVDLHRGRVLDEQTGKESDLPSMRPRECRFACEFAEAAFCGSGAVNICQLAILQPTCLDSGKDLNGVVGWINTPLARIRTAVEPYGYTLEHISRGEWKWAALPDVSREGVRISMEEQARLIKAAQHALNGNDHEGAVAHASAAIKLYPESWQGQVILGRCGLLEGIVVNPELLTRTARFLHNRRLTIRKAIPLVRAWSAMNTSSAPCPVIEEEIEIWETELIQHGELFDAAERFLRQDLMIRLTDGESPTDAYVIAIAKVWNTSPRVAGRLAELKTICDHPELACLIHQLEEILGGQDLPVRRSARRGCEAAVARLIKAFDSCPTIEQLVLMAREKLELLVLQIMARQPKGREKNKPSFLPEDIEPGPGGVWQQKHNPRRRPRRKRDDY